MTIKKTKVMIHGISGRMGKEIESIFLTNSPRDLELIGGSSSETSKSELENLIKSSDLIIDFSAPSASIKLFDLLKDNNITGKKILLCTTGLNDSDLSHIRKITTDLSLSTLRAANTSLGVLVLYKTAVNLASSLFTHGFDIELIETHHNQKMDAPSGTAKFLAEGMSDATGCKTQYSHPQTEKRDSSVIGMHAVRGGGVYGEHEIRFISDVEEISISHRALSRSLFAKGSIILSGLLKKKTAGFYEYGDLELNDL